jgi:hypothetical protein
MISEVFSYMVRHQFVSLRIKMHHVYIHGISDRIKKAAKKNKLSRPRSGAFLRLLIARFYRRKPIVRARVARIHQLSLEGSQRLMTVIKRRLPKTIQFEPICHA